MSTITLADLKLIISRDEAFTPYLSYIPSELNGKISIDSGDSNIKFHNRSEIQSYLSDTMLMYSYKVPIVNSLSVDVITNYIMSVLDKYIS